MIHKFWEKMKESLVSILPVTLIVLILNFTPLLNLNAGELWIFIGSAILLIIGMTFFNLGADVAMSPMGKHIGTSLMKTKKIPLILAICFIMGLLITVAEPDLSVLAGQVAKVINGQVLIYTVGLGVGIFLMLAIIKIVFKKDLSKRLMLFYMLIFMVTAIVAINGKEAFLALSYDSGGVTTGPITVPFIMALGLGIAQSVGGRESKENSFGLVALCSIGPVLVVLLLSLTTSGSIDYEIPAGYSINPDTIGMTILTTLGSTAKEVALSLGLICVCFLVINFIFIKLPLAKLIQIGYGIIITFVGLVLFLASATLGFMPIGYKLGCELANVSSIWVIIIGFILGMVVVLAEPAVHVLTKQVEEVTTGGVSKLQMLISLSVGVGIALGLSMIRIVFDFSILYYLIPGYFISLALSLFVPKVYTAIAFDSGGVASGPLTSSFILPLAIGACYVLQGESKILYDGFGIVAMVAMTPLITIQLLGFKSIITEKIVQKRRTKKILNADDEQIIYF